MSRETDAIIAERACGWTDLRAVPVSGMGDVLYGTRGGKRDSVPNYSTDLNAMAEAEKLLTPEQLEQYGVALAEEVGLGVRLVYLASAWKLATATAQQRAKALLAVLEGQR